MDTGFTVWPLLGFLTATAILVVAGLSLIPEIRNRPALPGGVANAAQWASQPADSSRPGSSRVSAALLRSQAPGRTQPYGQPGAGQHGPAAGALRPPPRAHRPPSPPPPRHRLPRDPRRRGSTASGEGSALGSGERPPA